MKFFVLFKESSVAIQTSIFKIITTLFTENYLKGDFLVNNDVSKI